ncbi:Regulator of protease activity HflC, stomatin/prohibitin superfamily [Micromonospora rhizosphaerae]|uniref:Regulator of protease activity HflC, stomatin/prohibitin superfamily n=1 Tax=Micromonospora rhizosphaerae TaxID=568872 RepID=A0A1C6SMU7_9ACTN|nr:slipin family protein [Micromonospora rhizosphaerae]SCL30911.1 Regulator of protease activity HflC, stomatin/prohibitin superfamily [Micromonospora rhizosphaerae]
MGAAAVVGLVIVIAIAVFVLSLSVRLVQQYQRGVVFRFGRVLDRIRQPGLHFIIPVADRMVRVSMQTTVIGVPAQGVITRDNVTVTVDAVVYYRVVDPVKVLVNVRDYQSAVLQVAQTALRSVIGKADLDTLLSNRDKINAELKAVIDAPTEKPWGLLIERVEVKDVALPEAMKRSMSRQAEAERERRARVIIADAEYQASRRLADASRTMSGTPGAYQLRLLQTVVDVAAEKNSTLVMPFPVEMLSFFAEFARREGAAPGGRGPQAQTTPVGPVLGPVTESVAAAAAEGGDGRRPQPPPG